MLRSRFVTAVLTVCVVALAAALSGCGNFSPPYMKPLSPQTRALLAEKGMLPTVAFTSLQTRAIRTLHLALEECARLWITQTKDWRLNERHYGGLTGLDKADTAARHGDDQVKIWRRIFDIPPPVLEAGSEFDLSADQR